MRGKDYGVPGAAKNTGDDACLLPSPLWGGVGGGDAGLELDM
jgi:hypothetical protein